MTIGGAAVGTIEINGGSQGTRTARIGGVFAGNANQGTVLTGQTVVDPDFADRLPVIDFDRLIADSAALASLVGQAIDTSDFNNKKIIGAPDTSGLSVFAATMADFGGGGYTIDLNGASTILVNVYGESGSFGMNALGGTFANAENVLWNFVEATSITVNSAIIGGILAPQADMSGFGGSTEGSVVANSITLNNGKLHSRGFAGDFPVTGGEPIGAVPLPAGLPLLLAGLGGLALLRRRR